MPQAAPQLAVSVDDATDLTLKAWKFLEAEMPSLGLPLREPVTPILDFRQGADANPMSREERLLLVQQAELLFEHLYPHMPFKTERFQVMHPCEFLRTVRARIDTLSETSFHSWLLAAFSLVRDAHTVYGLPSPYRGATAFLPFQVVAALDPKGQRRFLVGQVMASGPGGGFGHEFFRPGAEILEWAGSPIDLHVRRAAGRLPGGNPSAQFARATLACTIRPLTFCQFPFEEEMPSVDIVYRTQPMADDIHFIRLPWGVVRFVRPPAVSTSRMSISALNEELNRGRRAMCRGEAWKEREFRNSRDRRVVSEIPDAFEFQFTGGPRDGYPIDLAQLAVSGFPKLKLGYLRIKSFSDGSNAPGATDRLVEEARRILALLDEEAPDGLIVDIRGNSGGDIEAAERMLQLLTPRPITPENFHFANTEAIHRVMRGIRSGLARRTTSSAVRHALFQAKQEFEDWFDDADRVPYPRSLDRLTSGRPLTSPESCNDTGQVYHGRVVLLTDAFTYSAADIFAAGFEDHEIGVILGRDGATGGGGANVWSHTDLLTQLGPDPGIAVAPLPRDATMRLAIRRCSRVGKRQGEPIEDVGVEPSQRYNTNIVDDVLAGSPGMVQDAAAIVAGQMRLYRVDVPKHRLRGDGVKVTVRSTNVTALRFLLDDEPAGEGGIAPGATMDFLVHPAMGGFRPSTLRIEGYSNAGMAASAPQTLVTVRNIVLRQTGDEAQRSAAERSRRAIRRRRSHRRRRR